MKTYILLWLCCGLCAFSFGQSITNIEYYFNTDPGFGNATSISPNANSGDLTQTLNISVPNNAVGFNTLYIRTQDDNAVWSLYDKAIFYITDFNPADISDEITAAEYFFNTDPGFGIATPIIVNTNTGTLDQDLLLPLPTDMVGFNTIYIRVQDDFGAWSLYDKAIFFFTDFDTSGGATSITAIEYFIDTDPGFGSANSIVVDTNTGNTTQTASIPLGTLSEGFHNLFIRTQDDLGVWSLYDKRLFFVTPEQAISPIASAEYFYDTDPGFGNGTLVTLVPTGNLEEFTVDLSTTDITCDFHDFHIRLVNADGTWSLYDYGLQVEVFDNLPPTIVTLPNITAELDASGAASITLSDVNNGTFDDCELVSVVLNQAQFDYDCSDLGANTVTITAVDAENKTSTEDITITVVDLIDPTAAAQNITVQLGTNGTVTVLASELENGSTDNCSIANRSLDVSTFDCTNLGANTVTFTVTDTYGNTNATIAIITVEDSISPTADAQDITIELDASGNANLLASTIDQSTDNCSITSSTLDITAFNCNALGDNTVTLTVMDQSGNTDTTTAIVTIVDNIDPVAAGQNITVQLGTNGTVDILASELENGSTDNCSIANSSVDIATFNCNDLGDNNLSFTVTDTFGNTNSTTVIITVLDNSDPVAAAQNITVQLGVNGTSNILASDLENGSTDNCSIANSSVDISTFNCSDLGDNTVSFTVTDPFGNTNSTTAIVTIVDTIDPVAIPTSDPIIVELDENGEGSLFGISYDGGSTDNCGVVLDEISPLDYTCDDLGDVNATFEVFDDSGNMDTAPVIVTVVDNLDPTALGQDITIDLNGSASISITANAIDNGSNDNCGNVTLNIDIDTFTMAGMYPVEITVTDSSGNTSTITVIVTVTDSTLGLDDNELLTNSIIVYPNPSNHIINISTELVIDTFSVIDISGRVLGTYNGRITALGISSWSSGVYFMKFTVLNTEVIKQIIKK